MAKHAKLSPSSASRWTSCTASPAAQEGLPNESREASRMGTCGHQMAAECLIEGHDPQTYLGRQMGFPHNGNEDWADKFPLGTQFEFTHTVDQELIDAVSTYVNFVKQQRDLLAAEMFVEQSVPIGHITGEQDATGSSDVVLIAGDTICIIDAKFGRGRVYAYDVLEAEEVDLLTGEAIPPKRRMNLQMAMYALGSYEKFGLLADIKRVRGIIVQPFLGAVSEYECDLDELLALGRWLSERAALTTKAPEFVPSNKNCFFCRARFNCHARNAEVLSTALEGFDDVDSLAAAKTVPIFQPKVGQLWAKVDLIRQWCDDIEAAVQAQLERGETVIGIDGKPMKLVEGKKPHKAWSDEQEAMELMTKFRLKDLMWNKKLITPAQAEKLAPKKRKHKEAGFEEKTPLGKIQWTKLSALVTQGRGKPVAALSTDPRLPLVNATAGMSDESENLPNSDLF